LPKKSEAAFLAMQGFSFLPQRGYVLQPRLPLWATLGKKEKRISTATRLRDSYQNAKTSTTALRLKYKIGCLPRVGQSGNPGLKAVNAYGVVG